MRFKVRHVVIALVAYAYIVWTLAALNLALSGAFVIYAILCMLLARRFISGAEARSAKNVVEFSRSGALDSLGDQYGSFHHVFYSNELVLEAFGKALNEALTGKLECPTLHTVILRDVDRELTTPETRSFALTTAPETARHTECSLLCNVTRAHDIQTIRWWVLVQGVRDPNKLFWRYMLAPLAIPFALLSYRKHKRDALNGLMTVPPGFFNALDILNRTREIHFVAFETLVEVLETFGIDTTDLKLQKGNILNINVSGGQTAIGAVVQGARNKVTGTAGG